MTLEDLSADHPYSASDTNYFDRYSTHKFDTWKDFYDEYKNLDIDYNFIYRWDVLKIRGTYRMNLIMIYQRKGIYSPHIIHWIKEEDVEQIVEFLKLHYEKLQQMWQPLTNLFNSK